MLESRRVVSLWIQYTTQYGEFSTLIIEYSTKVQSRDSITVYFFCQKMITDNRFKIKSPPKTYYVYVVCCISNTPG